MWLGLDCLLRWVDGEEVGVYACKYAGKYVGVLVCMYIYMCDHLICW